jgi:hypothetical protein
MAKPQKIKHLWRGKFVFGSSSCVYYAHAYTATQAKMIMCRRISEEDNLPFFQVFNYFRDANCNIEIEMEFKEVTQ